MSLWASRCRSSWLRPRSWSSHRPWSWVGDTTATLSADTTIGDTTGTRIDTGDIITTIGTAGKKENTSGRRGIQRTPQDAPQRLEGWHHGSGTAVARARDGSLAGGGVHAPVSPRRPSGPLRRARVSTRARTRRVTKGAYPQGAGERPQTMPQSMRDNHLEERPDGYGDDLDAVHPLRLHRCWVLHLWQKATAMRTTAYGHSAVCVPLFHGQWLCYRGRRPHPNGGALVHQ